MKTGEGGLNRRHEKDKTTTMTMQWTEAERAPVRCVIKRCSLQQRAVKFLDTRQRLISPHGGPKK